MASHSHSCIILALFIAISFSSMDMALATRHLSPFPPLPPLPATPPLLPPLPPVPTVPIPITLPPLPPTPPLPPRKTQPSLKRKASYYNNHCNYCRHPLDLSKEVFELLFPTQHSNPLSASQQNTKKVRSQENKWWCNNFGAKTTSAITISL